MAERFVQLNSGNLSSKEPIIVSTGAGSGGLLIATDANGVIDSSFIVGTHKTSDFMLSPARTDLDEWETVSTFNFRGSSITGVITAIKLVAWMDNAITSFDARIVNNANGSILASVNSTNTETLTTTDMGVVSNIPTAEATLEIQLKRNGGTTSNYVQVEHLQLRY